MPKLIAILSEDENSYSEDEIPAKEPVVDEEEDNSEDEENEDGPEEEYALARGRPAGERG